VSDLNFQYRKRVIAVWENQWAPVPCSRSRSTRNCGWGADLARGREWTQKFWRKFRWIL